MAFEPVQEGAAADGRGIVLWVPTIADPAAPTVAELTAATAVRLTYGLTPDGFDLQVTVNQVTAGRYTLDQALSYEGTKDYTLTLRYVYNRENPTETEEILSVKGTPGFIVHILGYPNDHVITAADKINAVIPVRTATSTDVPPTANTELVKQQMPEITGKVHTEVAVVAA